MEINLDKVYEFLIRKTERGSNDDDFNNTLNWQWNGKQTKTSQTKNEEN